MPRGKNAKQMKMLRKQMGTSSEDTSNIYEAFNQLLGSGSPDGVPKINIIHPKYKKLRDTTLQLLKEFAQFQATFCSKYPELVGVFNELKDFNENCKNMFIQTYTNKLGIDVEEYSKEEKIEFGKVYNKAKDCIMTKMFIVFAQKLAPFREILMDTDNPNINFPKNIKGLYFQPFLPKLQIDFKYVWLNLNPNKEIKTFLFNFMKSVYMNSMDLYHTIIQPDVDIDEFAEILMKHLKIVKKQLPRCKTAFSKIENAIGMLKGNFGNYYKEFVQTKNPTSIIENFIVDVSENTEADARLIREFKEIVNYFKKKSQNVKDPRAKKILEQLNEKLSMFDSVVDQKVPEVPVKEDNDPEVCTTTHNTEQNTDHNTEQDTEHNTDLGEIIIDIPSNNTLDNISNDTSNNILDNTSDNFTNNTSDDITDLRESICEVSEICVSDCDIENQRIEKRA